MQKKMQTNDLAELKAKAQQFLGKQGDIKVKEYGKFILAYSEHVNEHGFNGDPRVLGVPVKRHDIWYLVIDTLRDTAQTLWIQSEHCIEEADRDQDRVFCVLYDKYPDGKYRDVGEIEIKKFIDISTKAGMDGLMEQISKKNPDFFKLVKNILNMFEGNDSRISSLKRGIENLLKLDASNVLRRQNQRKRQM